MPACTRNICRGAAVASRLDPLAFRFDKRARSKALFFAVHDGTSISDPELSNFHATQRTGPVDEALSELTAKDINSAHIIFFARAAIVPLLGWLPACVAQDFCNPEDPKVLGDDSSFFAVTQQQ